MTAARLQERYTKEIVPALSQKLGRENRLSLPKLCQRRQPSGKSARTTSRSWKRR